MNKIILICLFTCIISNINAVNTIIFSEGISSSEALSGFLKSGNSKLGDELTLEFAEVYIEESKFEGINWDIAFVQMCLETGYLKYGGLVEPGQNNFCGLGSYESKKGASFNTIREGVRAHIQHLKAYATESELNGELIDPRFHLVTRGSAKSVLELAGRWAEDPRYGFKIISMLKRMLHFQHSDSILLVNNVDTEDEEKKTKDKKGWLR